MNPYDELDLGWAGEYQMIGHPHAGTMSFKTDSRTVHGVEYSVRVLVTVDTGRREISRVELHRTGESTLAHYDGAKEWGTPAAIKTVEAEVQELLDLIPIEGIAQIRAGKRQTDLVRLDNLLSDASAWHSHLQTQLHELERGRLYDAYPDREVVESEARAREGTARAEGSRGEGGEAAQDHVHQTHVDPAQDTTPPTCVICGIEVPKQRRARVLGVDQDTDLDELTNRIRAYLPDSFTVLIELGGDVVIVGNDVAGWTLDDYVLPRLASGLIFAEEVT